MEEGTITVFGPDADPVSSPALHYPWAEGPLAVIDFETTGLDPENDRVLEMGVAVFDKGDLVESRGWLINPARPVPAEASAVHGITNEMLANAPTFAAAFDEALPMLTGRLPMAYNAPFDRAFLRAEFSRLGRAVPESAYALDESTVWIDPLVWVRELQKYEKGKKLTDAARRLNIALNSAHRAEHDAEAAGRVMLALAKRNRISERVPTGYADLLREQARLAEAHAADFAAWKARKNAEAQR